MDGKAGAPIVSDGIKDQPGEGVVPLEHVSETYKSYKTEIRHWTRTKEKIGTVTRSI